MHKQEQKIAKDIFHTDCAKTIAFCVAQSVMLQNAVYITAITMHVGGQGTVTQSLIFPRSFDTLQLDRL